MAVKGKKILFLALIPALILVVLAGEQPVAEDRQDHNEVPEAKDEKIDARQDAKMWALACSALLVEAVHGRHDLLGADLRTPRNIEKTKEFLAFEEGWAIENKSDLFECFKEIDRGGSRVDFEHWGTLLQTLSEQEYEMIQRQHQDDLEVLQSIRIAKEYYEKLGPKSIIGWDYGRYICLCRWGYMAGYLTEEQAWVEIIPVAKMLQKTFDSWEDLGRNYLIGRQFWSYENTQKEGYFYEDAFQRLIDMKSSPWVKYPWDMDLTAAEPETLEPGEYDI